MTQCTVIIVYVFLLFPLSFSLFLVFSFVVFSHHHHHHRHHLISIKDLNGREQIVTWCVCLFICLLCETFQNETHRALWHNTTVRTPKTKTIFRIIFFSRKKINQIGHFYISVFWSHTHTHTHARSVGTFCIMPSELFHFDFCWHFSWPLLARSLFFTTSFGNCLIYCCNSNGCLNSAYKTIENRKHNIWS